ncbi:hypothetical protein GCM10020254_72740 [Streptomyces goshikiensis]
MPQLTDEAVTPDAPEHAAEETPEGAAPPAAGAAAVPERSGTWMTPAEYGASRAALWTGALVLVTDTDGRVLLQTVDYRPDRLMPGGAVDAGESPAAAAAREMREELGVDGHYPHGLAVDWIPADTPRLPARDALPRGDPPRLRRRHLDPRPDRRRPPPRPGDHRHRVRRAGRPPRPDGRGRRPPRAVRPARPRGRSRRRPAGGRPSHRAHRPRPARRPAHPPRPAARRLAPRPRPRAPAGTGAFGLAVRPRRPRPAADRPRHRRRPPPSPTAGPTAGALPLGYRHDAGAAGPACADARTAARLTALPPAADPAYARLLATPEQVRELSDWGPAGLRELASVHEAREHLCLPAPPRTPPVELPEEGRHF